MRGPMPLPAIRVCHFDFVDEQARELVGIRQEGGKLTVINRVVDDVGAGQQADPVRSQFDVSRWLRHGDQS